MVEFVFDRLEKDVAGPGFVFQDFRPYDFPFILELLEKSKEVAFIFLNGRNQSLRPLILNKTRVHFLQLCQIQIVHGFPVHILILLQNPIQNIIQEKLIVDLGLLRRQDLNLHAAMQQLPLPGKKRYLFSKNYSIHRTSTAALLLIIL